MSKGAIYTNPATTRDYCDAECHRCAFVGGTTILTTALTISFIIITSLGIRGVVSGAVVGGVSLGFAVPAAIILMQSSQKALKIAAVVFGIIAVLSALAIPGYIPVKVVSLINLVSVLGMYAVTGCTACIKGC